MNAPLGQGRRHSRRLAALLAAPALASIVLVAQAPRTLGVDSSGFDQSIRPQDDFNGFVNGTWMRKTEIPPDRSTWGSFPELSEKSEAALKEIVDTAVKTPATAGSERQQVADFYSSFMDTAGIESLGIEPLGPELKRIAAVSATADLPALFGHLAHIGVSGPFVAGVGQDQKQSDTYITLVSQGGLGMPDRDYYLRNDEKSAAIREAYADLHHDAPRARQAARSGGSRSESWRSRRASPSGSGIARAPEIATPPTTRWTSSALTGVDARLRLDQPIFEGGRRSKPADVVVRQPDYFSALDAIVRETPIAAWKEYLTFRLLTAYADELPAAFGDAQFEFRRQGARRPAGDAAALEARRLRGRRGARRAARPTLCRAVTSSRTRRRAWTARQEPARGVQGGIDELEWMGAETKAQAQAKLAKFTVKIGYPDKWRDYSALDVKTDDLVGNAMRGDRQFEYDDMAGRLGKPVDRSRWGMTPQTVNAYYSSAEQRDRVPGRHPPAAVLQRRCRRRGQLRRDRRRDRPRDQPRLRRSGPQVGRRRQPPRLVDAPTTLEAFEERAASSARSTTAYDPLPSLHINGRQTMGENIGDLERHRGRLPRVPDSLGGTPAPVIDGFTGDQRFFLGWAQVWRSRCATTRCDSNS